MKLLANENIPLASVTVLRDAGHDVLSLSLDSPGIDDETVFALAREQGRIIITLDRDYGELVFRRRLPNPPGVIYMRLVPQTPTDPAEVLQSLFEQGIEITGHFLVVERDHIRRRPLPE